MNNIQRKMLADGLKNTAVGILLGVGILAFKTEKTWLLAVAGGLYVILLFVGYYLLKDVHDD